MATRTRSLAIRGAVGFMLVLAFFAFVSPANAASFVGAPTGPNEWTYTLTYDPLDNYAVCPSPGNIATITLRGLASVVSATAPTSTDFVPPGGFGDVVNLQWTPQVSGGGTMVTWTHVGPGTGNYAVQKHVYGFKVFTASSHPSGTVSVASSGFSVDVSSTGPCPVQPADDRDFTRTTVGPVSPVQLYVTEGNYFGQSSGSLLRIDLASRSIEPLTPPGTPGEAQGFVTVAGNSVYWGGGEPYLGNNGVRRANLDGSSAQGIVDSWMPMGVAVDEVHGKLYWAEAAQHAIRRSNLDGSVVEELVSGVGCCYIASPFGIALDVPNGKIYWANMASHMLQRSNLDGSSVENLVTVAGSPSGIALDPVEHKLYWAEQAGTIRRSDLNGTHVETVLAQVPAYVMGLAIDPVGRTLYWTSEQPGRVMKANLDGSGVETIASTGLAAVSGIAVYRIGDTTPPTLTLPEPMSVNATQPTGAMVTYSVTATDDIDPNPSLSCTPPSGSVFAIGTTTVNCTATDASGNSATASFTVHVKGAAEQLADLGDAVKAVGPGKSLTVKVGIAEWFVAHSMDRAACMTLTAFNLEVRALSRKKIAPAQAMALLADSNRIKKVLGC